MSTVSEALESAVREFLNYSSVFSGHTANKENPHQVTKNQIGLENVLNIEQAGKTEFYSHVNSRTNPHCVTREQVGLGNVSNVRQATKTEFDAHVAGSEGRHKAEDIIYEGGEDLKNYLRRLVLDSGAGTMDHSLLENRDMENAHPVSAISGLPQAIGREAYTFLGATTDEAETELFSDSTGTYIDDNGRIKIPVGTALAFEISVICGARGLGRILVASFGKQSGVLMRIINLGVQLRINEVEYVNGEVLEGATFRLIPDTAPSVEGDGGMKLLVKGTGVSLLWKAVVKIIPLSIGEFGE